MAHKVVMNLVEGLEGKGYHIFTDNFYSSPSLFSELHDRGFEACGTVRIDRVGIPKVLQKTTVPPGVCVCLCERERDKDRDRETETERKTERQRERQKEIYRQRGRMRWP